MYDSTTAVGEELKQEQKREEGLLLDQDLVPPHAHHKQQRRSLSGDLEALWCSHHESKGGRGCLAYGARCCLRAFLVGAVSKGALDVIAARLRRRPTGAARTLTGALRSFLDARFGLFLACLIGGSNCMSCLIKRLVLLFSSYNCTWSKSLKNRLCTSFNNNLNMEPVSSTLFTAIEAFAGAFGGALSASFAPASQRRIFGLYFFFKSCELLAQLSASGKPNSPVQQSGQRESFWQRCKQRAMSNIDVLLICLTASQILSSFIFAPGTINPTYLRFLVKQSSKDPRAIRVLGQLGNNQPIDRQALLEYCQDRNLDFQQVYRDTIEKVSSCALLHPHMSCSRNFVSSMLDGMKKAIWLYIPIHTVAAIIITTPRLWRLFKQTPEQQQQQNKLAELSNVIQNALLKMVINILRSCTFLGLYISIGWLCSCVVSKCGPASGMIKAQMILRPMLCLSGLSCLIEPKSRRMDLALYCLPQALDSLLEELVARNFISAWLVRSPAVEATLFGGAWAVAFACWRLQPGALRPTLQRALAWLSH